MAERETRHRVRMVPLGEFLARLPRLELERQQLSQRLQDLPLETQLLSLADVSIERETEGLKEVLSALEKL